MLAFVQVFSANLFKATRVPWLFGTIAYIMYSQIPIQNKMLYKYLAKGHKDPYFFLHSQLDISIDCKLIVKHL